PWAEGGKAHRAGVLHRLTEQLTRLDVPDPSRIVVAGGDNTATIGTEGREEDQTAVAQQRANRPAGGRVADARPLAAVRCHYEVAARTQPSPRLAGCRPLARLIPPRNAGTLQSRDIPDADPVVVAGGGDPVAVGTEGGTTHRPLVLHQWRTPGADRG